MAESAAPHRIYSCDDHLDIYHLPADVWTERLPAKYRELGPHVIERKGQRWWVAGKQFLGISGSYPGLATGRGHEDDDGLRPGDPVLRMEDMARDDIYASVVLISDKLYAVSRFTGTYVLEATPELKQIAHNTLADESDFSASPAVSDGQLILRSDKYLYCIQADQGH